jgi:hypothetical protein
VGDFPHPFFIKRRLNMKIKAKKSNITNVKLIVPIDGLISVDKDGVADVSAKCATTLVKCTNDWDFFKGSKSEKEEVSDESNEVNEDQPEEKNSEREEMEAHLDTLNLAEMKEYAKEAEFPESEYEKINSKKTMKAYLLKKYDNASKEEVSE